jgi:hypothetical protein
MKNITSKMLMFSLICTLMGLVACQQNGANKDEKNQEVQYARLSYDRCLQINHYEACNSVRSTTVLSMKEYFGLNTNYNFNGTNNVNYGYGINRPGYNGFNQGYNQGYNQAYNNNGFNQGYNGYNGYNQGYNGNIYSNSLVTQYSAQQIDDYFSNYVRRAAKEEILDMAARWNSGNTSMQYQNANPYYRSCTTQGCF